MAWHQALSAAWRLLRQRRQQQQQTCTATAHCSVAAVAPPTIAEHKASEVQGSLLAFPGHPLLGVEQHLSHLRPAQHPNVRPAHGSTQRRSLSIPTAAAAAAALQPSIATSPSHPKASGQIVAAAGAGAGAGARVVQSNTSAGRWPRAGRMGEVAPVPTWCFSALKQIPILLARQAKQGGAAGRAHAAACLPSARHASPCPHSPVPEGPAGAAAAVRGWWCVLERAVGKSSCWNSCANSHHDLAGAE